MYPILLSPDDIYYLTVGRTIHPLSPLCIPPYHIPPHPTLSLPQRDAAEVVRFHQRKQSQADHMHNAPLSRDHNNHPRFHHPGGVLPPSLSPGLSNHQERCLEGSAASSIRRNTWIRTSIRILREDYQQQQLQLQQHQLSENFPPAGSVVRSRSCGTYRSRGSGIEGGGDGPMNRRHESYSGSFPSSDYTGEDDAASVGGRPGGRSSSGRPRRRSTVYVVDGFVEIEGRDGVG